MSIIDRDPGSPSPCDPGHRPLGAISVANLCVQDGMRLQYVAWLALGLAAGQELLHRAEAAGVDHEQATDGCAAFLWMAGPRTKVPSLWDHWPLET